jgi:hypothetical protein
VYATPFDKVAIHCGVESREPQIEREVSKLAKLIRSPWRDLVENSSCPESGHRECAGMRGKQRYCSVPMGVSDVAKMGYKTKAYE